MPARDPGSTPAHGSAVGHAAASTPFMPDFELVRAIGRGAYGEVWLARHKTLGTWRAIKVIRRADFDDDRPFRREFEGIRHYEPISRGHPNLVAVLHVGGDDAGFYYVMELADSTDPAADVDSGSGSEVVALGSARDLRAVAVGPAATTPQTLGLAPHATGHEVLRREGAGRPILRTGGLRSPDPTDSSGFNQERSDAYAPRTLRRDLKVRGQLTADETIRIGRALAGALAHLHAHALVHRDVKPSNVIFVGGVLKLADIGLVTDISDARSFVGTEGYVPAEGPGTASADCHALGRLLYELSTGRDRRDFPAPPADLPTRPDRERLLELNAVLHRACAPDPHQRYPDARAMLADLERLEAGLSVRARHAAQQRRARLKQLAAPVAGLLLVAALAFAALRPGHRTQPGPPPGAAAASPHSVFVLPLRNAGTNEADNELCGRVTDAFIDSLTLVPGVAVGPRKSGWVALDEEELRRSLARTNAMGHILTGRLGTADDTLTLALRLYANGEDQPLWTEAFTGTTNQVIEFERRGLAGVAKTLGFGIPEETQQRIDLLLTNNLEALGWFRKARQFYWAKGDYHSVFIETMGLLQRALALDPGYLDADQFDAYCFRFTVQVRAPSEIWPAFARRMDAILARDDTHAGALEHRGGCALILRHDWDESEQFIARELQFTAGPFLHVVRGFWLRMRGRPQEGMAEQLKAEDPEPVDGILRYTMSSARWAVRDYDGAIRAAKRTLEIYPDNRSVGFWVAVCLVAKGEYDRGLEAIRQAQAFGKRQELTALEATAYALMGRKDEAWMVLGELLKLEGSEQHLNPYFVARVYAALGEKERALDWLQKTIDGGSDFLFVPDWGGLRTDWAWDGLTNETRYWHLCEQIGMGKDQWPR